MQRQVVQERLLYLAEGVSMGIRSYKSSFTLADQNEIEYLKDICIFERRLDSMYPCDSSDQFVLVKVSSHSALKPKGHQSKFETYARISCFPI